MDKSRRDFLKGTAWMVAAAVAAGCISKGNALGKPPAREWSRNGDEDAWKGLCDLHEANLRFTICDL